MVSHDVLKECADYALMEWSESTYRGNWHPLPAAEDVWEGRWLTGFHFQVACPGGELSNCHPFFVKMHAELPQGMFEMGKRPFLGWKESKRYAVACAKELRRRGTPVVGVWLVTKNGRRLVYGSANTSASLSSCKPSSCVTRRTSWWLAGCHQRRPVCDRLESRMMGNMMPSGKELIVGLIIVSIVGWAVITGLIKLFVWLFGHISISFV